MSNPPPPASSLRGAVDLSSLVNRPAPGATTPGAETSSGGASAEVQFTADDGSFQRVLELSRTVPVLVEFIAPGLEPALGGVVAGYGGRIALAVIDGTRSPQLAQAFQVREVPTVAAVVGGRPLSLFVGIPSEPEVRQVVDQVLELAAQSGVTGTIDVAAQEESEPEEPVEEPLPPHHREAYEAIERGDYAAAIVEYRAAITENPRDQLAIAGLAQVSLLERLEGTDTAAVRAAAAERPGDAGAQLAVADLDLGGGHVDDAFDRLLELFPALAPKDRDLLRERLLEYFEIVGADDARVAAARRRLALLLF